MNDLVTTLQQRKFSILLLGDVCIDRYEYGLVERISPEAPVPIFVKTHTTERMGMAHNVYNNLLAMHCRVNFLHTDDPSIKTRYIDSKTKQQLIRVDDDKFVDPIELATAIPPIYDAIVISDYNKGYIAYDTVEALREEFKGKIYIDTKKPDLQRFAGCYTKINDLERRNATSWHDDVITTLGEHGASYRGKIIETSNVEVADVTGAGDVFLAGLAVFDLLFDDIRKAVRYANHLAAMSVQHHGVYTISQQDLNEFYD